MSDLDVLVKQMRICAGMLYMGEKIKFGWDSGLLEAGADKIDKLRAELEALKATFESCNRARQAAEEELDMLKAK